LFQSAVCVNVRRIFAGIAQLVEQLICNQQVVGSNPTAGSLLNASFLDFVAGFVAVMSPLCALELHCA
jgi:hypothetical protein